MASGEQQRGPRRVVIVSDDPLFVAATSIDFRADAGFAVYHCPSTARAPAEVIARTGCEAVLVDDTGAGDAALDLVRDLCAQVERPAVLVLSAGADRVRHERILDLGAVAAVSKAIHSGALVTFVRELLADRIVVRTDLGTDVRRRASRRDRRLSVVA